MRKLTNKELAEIGSIENKGKAEGYECHNAFKNKRRMQPRYPSFIYRLNGIWKGWNVFLSTPKDSFQSVGKAKRRDPFFYLRVLGDAVSPRIAGKDRSRWISVDH